MGNSMLDREISMTKFLSLFFGINPAKARHITHKDLRVIYPTLESFSDFEFWKLHSYEDLINYIKVKDKDNKIMYYTKIKVKTNELPIECSDSEYNDESELNALIIPLQGIDLDNLDKWELCELKRKLKNIKKINRKVLDEEISAVKKQLQKIRKENIL